ncbi:MAG: mannose-1-phosphate guanylyltransferase/mannose-6-phosphate isomerase [Gammaproteobacteria bacterium]|nr:mannose-1-phosphate guanylyltransferase/mannose-6-phosphate isomerase [Gammaproteobacteria bacterium]MCP5459968.1 mannose-1-phosphate guanylyltransferase/mannose-6-phosphate isomerase [Gammaproteobacteria bacterium]
MLVPVVLSGGTGSRLWPLSREIHPKQFLSLANSRSLLQNTVLRAQHLPGATAPVVVCNETHRFLVAEQLHSLALSPAAIILEPVGRNTAPAVAVAALHSLEQGEDPLLLVLPADHVITEQDAFCNTVTAVLGHAEAGKLITFGIVPRSPETGYGYIKAGPADGTVSPVERFVEKPDQDTARQYVASGHYYWNSGMFLFRASRFLEELELFSPAILAACRQAYATHQRDLDFLRLERDAFTTCPSDSIDYAIMEKTADAVVKPLDVAWSDIGSWSALWEVGEHDANGNSLRGDVVTLATRDSYVYSSDRLVATLGVDDLIVIETSDAVLVAHKSQVQDVKQIVTRLQEEQRPEYRTHRKVYRPWGSYDSIDTAARFQVKHITVNPGASLSLQMHHHRAEHWTVVRGTARVTRGDEVFLLSENQSTYIPVGTLHRLENPGKIPLELIEVQSGSYLEEDDIVRFDDAYGRQSTP